MLESLGYMILLGLLLASIFKFFKLPTLIGFILSGIILGPFVLDLMDGSILAISAQLRTFALVIILLRAGLSLNVDKLIKSGRSAILLTFVPATLEMIGVTLFTYYVFNWAWIDGIILASILAAVSPAVIVPRMIQLINHKLGTDKSIPEMVMAGASVDDIYVILIFTSTISLKMTNTLNMNAFLYLPVSIILGILLGILFGFILVKLFKKFHMRDTIKVLIIIGVSLLLISLEKTWITYSGLFSIIALGAWIFKDYRVLSERLLKKYEKIWVFAEMLLFILIGAAMDLSTLDQLGLITILLIGFALVFRSVGVIISLIGSKLNKHEKQFVIISYLPKATVQASIGAIPLALGLTHGNDMLTVAVISILITAPIGAFLMDHFSNKWLTKGE